MSGSLMGMQGLGAAGNGMMPSTGQIPPGILAMLMAQQGQQPGMQQGPMPGQQVPGAPMMMPPGQHPMGQNMAPQMPQQGPPQQMPGMASAMGGGGLSALLAALKGGQSGVAPQPNMPGGPLAPNSQPGAGNLPTGGPEAMGAPGMNASPSPGLMAMLQHLFGGGGQQ